MKKPYVEGRGEVHEGGKEVVYEATFSVVRTQLALLTLFSPRPGCLTATQLPILGDPTFLYTFRQYTCQTNLQRSLAANRSVALLEPKRFLVRATRF